MCFTFSLKEIETLEDNINAAMVSQWTKRMTKKAHKVAIDLVLIPYHGLPEEEEACPEQSEGMKSDAARLSAAPLIFIAMLRLM